MVTSICQNERSSIPNLHIICIETVEVEIRPMLGVRDVAERCIFCKSPLRHCVQPFIIASHLKILSINESLNSTMHKGRGLSIYGEQCTTDIHVALGLFPYARQKLVNLGPLILREYYECTDFMFVAYFINPDISCTCIYNSNDSNYKIIGRLIFKSSSS
jgi:hypothetical protein